MCGARWPTKAEREGNESVDDVTGGAKNRSVCEGGHPSETKLKSSRLVRRSNLSVGRLKGKRPIGGTKLDPKQLG